MFVTKSYKISDPIHSLHLPIHFPTVVTATSPLHHRRRQTKSKIPTVTPSMEAHEPESFHWRYIDFDDRDFQIRGRTFLFAAVLFAILLLITFLFLYTRCRYRHLHHAAAHTSLSPHAPPSRPRGLDPSTIKSFPIVLHTSSSDTKSVDESECCICLGVFGDGEKVKVLPNCRHCFHSECVDKWLSSQPSCPLCRSSLRVDSPV